MIKKLTIFFTLLACVITVNTASAQCTDWVAPNSTGGWTDFNGMFGGAPCDDGSGCAFNEITAFEVFAAEAYAIDNFIAGGEYAFSMCNGPGVGAWVPEFTIIAPSGAVDAFGAGDGDGCTITWTASENGTYLIVINEAGECGGGPNQGTGNGYPAITCNSGAACTSAITLTVDMNEYTGSFTTVFVSGAFNGWDGGANPMADNGDGTWSTTLMLAGGSQEYKFQVDEWTDQENFAGGESCTVTTDGFTNRVIDVMGDATIDPVCWNSCDACLGLSDGMVTLTVDMSEYTDAFTTVYVSGSFNGWAGDANAMTDNGDGTWTTTIMLPGGNHEYKFTIDNWAVQENFAGGESCTVTTDGFTNRIIFVDGDLTVDPVCWNSCDFCGAPQPGMVTLSVDMAEFTETFTTVYVSGAFNGWDGGANPMTDNGDGTWTVTVMMPGGDQEYKFQVDQWAFDDQFMEGDPCTVTTDGFTNRVVSVDGDTTVDLVCFSSCFACGMTSLSETELAQVSMESFPNPADDILNIQFETPVSADATLNLTDVLGRTVQNIELGTLNAGDHTELLDVSRLNKGVYVLTLQLDGQIARTQNIVIQ